MFRKMLLGTFLVFVVLPGIWLCVEHFRGSAHLAAAIRRVEARGEFLDLQKMLPPSVPPSSNGLGALMAASQQMRNVADVMPPAYEVIGPGRAVPGTRMEWWTGMRGTNTWETLRSALASNESEFDALHAAVAMPYRRADLDLSQGFNRMRIPHLASIKLSGTVLAASAVEAARQGDLDGAILDMKAIRTIESDLQSEPLLISQLVRMSLGMISNTRFWSVLNGQDWTEAQLAQLQEALPSADFFTAVIRSLEGERAGGLYEIRNAKSQELAEVLTGDAIAQAFGGGTAPLTVPESVDEAVEFAGTFVERLSRGLLAHVILPVWRFGWGEQAGAFYLECMDGLLEVNRRAQRERSYLPVQEFDLVARLEQPGYGRLRSVFAKLTLPTLERASIKAFRLETERALNETGIALRRFRIRHGQLPETLEALVPAFLGEMPIDRMDGKPLRYRRDGENAFTLWSVGENLKDDGGDATWPEERAKSANRQWWLAKDAVWPQPATPGEIADWHRQEAEKLEKKKRASDKGNGTQPRFQMSPELLKRYGLVPSEAVPATATNTVAPAPKP